MLNYLAGMNQIIVVRVKQERLETQFIQDSLNFCSEIITYFSHVPSAVLYILHSFIVTKPEILVPFL